MWWWLPWLCSHGADCQLGRGQAAPTWVQALCSTSEVARVYSGAPTHLMLHSQSSDSRAEPLACAARQVPRREQDDMQKIVCKALAHFMRHSHNSENRAELLDHRTSP